MNNIVLLIIILVSIFAGGYLFGSKVEEYNHAIDKLLNKKEQNKMLKIKNLLKQTSLLVILGLLMSGCSAPQINLQKTYNRANESVYDFKSLRKDAVQLLHDISKELTN